MGGRLESGADARRRGRRGRGACWCQRALEFGCKATAPVGLSVGALLRWAAAPKAPKAYLG
jgi:hypothetical protein